MRIFNSILPATLLALSFQAQSQSRGPDLKLEKKIQIYVGNGPCNNGEVSTNPKHKGCSTRSIGYTIDDASAMPADGYIEVFAGNDVGNNKIVSKDSNFQNGSMESIGYLSKNPVPGGSRIYSGNEPCNNGIATTSTKHGGCGTEFLGYSAP
jgi:hypothetical protein